MRYNITVNPRFIPTGMGMLASAVAQTGLPDASVVFYRKRNVLARLESENLVLKCFRRTGLIKGLIYRWLRMPKSRRAYNNAMRLRELGISTPEPMFCIECFGAFGAMNSSFYACEDLAGWSEVRGVEKRPDFPQLAAALAAFIFDIHSKHVLMLDMTPGNILFRKNADGTFDFSLVDINRMRFGVSDLGTLYSNFDALLDTEDGTAEVAKAYESLLRRNNIAVGSVGLENTMRRRYRAYFKRKMRQRRIKSLLHLK